MRSASLTAARSTAHWESGRRAKGVWTKQLESSCHLTDARKEQTEKGLSNGEITPLISFETAEIRSLAPSSPQFG
jgi:hypothetical protein